MKKAYTVSDLFYDCWEQLTQKQLVTVIWLSDVLSSQKEGSVEYGLTVIGILRALRKNFRLVDKINEKQAVDCFNDIKFFHRNADGSFKTPWYFFPVIGFNVNGKRFRRPELNGSLPMYNRSFQQLVYADSAFSGFCVLNYQHSKEPSAELEKEMDEALCSLIAVLYTEPEDFTMANLEMKAELIRQKLTVEQRSLILHTYANVRSFITDRCPNLMPKPAENAEKEATPVFTGPMWLKLRYSLAETEVFKGFTTANNAMIYDALDYLEEKALEAANRKTNG